VSAGMALMARMLSFGNLVYS